MICTKYVMFPYKRNQVSTHDITYYRIKTTIRILQLNLQTTVHSVPLKTIERIFLNLTLNVNFGREYLSWWSRHIMIDAFHENKNRCALT